MDAIAKDVLANFTDFNQVRRDGAKLVLALNDTRIQQFQDEAVDQAMLVIRRRIDKWGVAEVDVRKLGTDAIQISLPGRQDPEQAKELIGTTAQLEFRMVDDTNPWASDTFRNTPPPAESNITFTTAEGFPQLEAREPRGPALLRAGQGARRPGRAARVRARPHGRQGVLELPHLPGRQAGSALRVTRSPLRTGARDRPASRR